MAEVQIGNQYRYTGGAPLDSKHTPVQTVEDLKRIPRSQRYVGLTVLVKNWDGEGHQAEYWLSEGTADKDWKRKNHVDCGEI